MAADTTGRIEQIVSEIRARVNRRTNRQLNGSAAELTVPAHTNQQGADLSAYRAQLRHSADALAHLDDNIAQSVERIGACPPSPPTQRGRIGAVVIRNLSRLLWWQNQQIRETVNLVVRRNREQAASGEKASQMLCEAVSESFRIGSGFDRMQGDLIGLRSQLESLDSTVAKLTSDVAAMNRSLREVAKTQDRLVSELSRINRQNVEQQGGLEQIRLRMDTAIQPSVDQLLQDHLRQRIETAQRAEELNRLFQMEMDQIRQRLREMEEGIQEFGRAAESRAANTFETQAGTIFEELRARLSALESRAADGGNRQLTVYVQTEIARMEDSIAALQSIAAASPVDGIQSEIERLNGSVSSINDRLSDVGLATHRLRSDVSAQQARLSHVLREVRKSQPLQEAEPSRAVRNADRVMQGLYVDFEDVFRGSRNEIRERQREYLPVVRETGAGSADRPVLDLGCGRGEWLEELRSQGLDAIGIDSSTAMVEFCRGMGLNVLESEALTHLSSLADDSLGAITSFHMIEHMPFEDVISLLDEGLRVLRPGGLIILETPNPGNLAVGASTFYLDPTHIRPVPSQLLQFAAEARGFCDIRIMGLHPYPDTARLPEDTAFGRRFNECFYGPQDYALIARKP